MWNNRKFQSVVREKLCKSVRSSRPAKEFPIEINSVCVVYSARANLFIATTSVLYLLIKRVELPRWAVYLPFIHSLV